MATVKFRITDGKLVGVVVKGNYSAEILYPTREFSAVRDLVSVPDINPIRCIKIVSGLLDLDLSQAKDLCDAARSAWSESLRTLIAAVGGQGTVDICIERVYGGNAKLGEAEAA